jgi:glycosyltransferase involved in cell wall biosynthesis
MSKIAIDARELTTSTGRYVNKLLQYIQSLDEENSYKVLIKSKDSSSLKITNDNFSPVISDQKEFSFAEQLSLLDLVKSLDQDLVHFCLPQQPVRYKGKTVTTIHDLTTLRFVNPDKNYLVFKVKQKVFAWVIKKAVRKSSAVITPTQYVKDDLIKFTDVNPDKVTVTYEAADVIRDKAEPVLELTGKQFIMYIGRPTPHKNLGRLIQAFVSLRESHPELVLVLAGKKDSNYERIESEYKDVEGLLFTGFTTEGQLRWLYENTQAYVFPSLSEGFGLPGLEAMVHGAPVISSNYTCLPEVYGDAAVYFDPKNVPQMADAILSVLDNPKLRDQLVLKGHVQADKYSWEQMARETLDIYNKVLKP